MLLFLTLVSKENISNSTVNLPTITGAFKTIATLRTLRLPPNN